MTMGTYDLFFLALDMEGRVDEAEDVWHRLLETHSRSISRRLFSRMISLYEHHHLSVKILEVVDFPAQKSYLHLSHLASLSNSLAMSVHYSPALSPPLFSSLSPYICVCVCGHILLLSISLSLFIHSCSLSIYIDYSLDDFLYLYIYSVLYDFLSL